MESPKRILPSPSPAPVLQSELQAAGTLRGGLYARAYGDLNLDGLIASLKEQTRASSGGDLKRAMLMTQAHTLDAIFNNLAQTALINAEFMPNLECYLKLELRAQSQCWATWETLSTIKNPSAVGYVRQANACTAGRTDPAMATVGEIDRTKDRDR